MFDFGCVGENGGPGGLAGVLCAHDIARAGHEPLRGDPCGYLGFQRLSIMGLDERGMQPFCLDGDYVVCNGELYGFRPLRERLKEKYAFASESDCEILLPLYREYGLEMFRALDAEFALVLYDARKNRLIAARDPIGIRPLYYGAIKGGGMAFASEPKDLVGLCETILPFPPGCYWADGRFVRYADAAHVDQFAMVDEDTACARLHDLLIEGVKKRLDADAPIGFCFPADWIPRWCAPSPGAN